MSKQKFVVVRRYLLEEYHEVEASSRKEACRKIALGDSEQTGDALLTSNCFDFSVHPEGTDIISGVPTKKPILEIDEDDL